MGKQRRAPRRTLLRGTTTEGRVELETSFERSGRFHEVDEFDIYADDEWEDELFDWQPRVRIEPRRRSRWFRRADGDRLMERGA